MTTHLAESMPPPASALRIAAAVSTVIAAVLWVGPSVLRADLVDGDAAHHVWWLYLYADADLFPGDVMVEYFRTSAPLGYRLLYSSVAPVMDVLLVAKVLAGVLYALGAWLAWKIATAVEGPDRELRGLLAVLAFVVVVLASNVSSGGALPPIAFQRTFSLPLVLLCLWALVARRYVWVGGAWLGAALFYPVLLPGLGLGAGVVFLRHLVVEKRMPPSWVPNGALAVAALAIAVLGMPTADHLGPALDYREASAMPEFGPEGRLQLHFGSFLGDLFWGHMMGLGWTAPFMLVLTVAALLTWFARRDLLPLPAFALLGVGLALWGAMRLFPEYLMFDLYLPNRHSRWVIAAFAIVAFGSAAYVLLAAASSIASRGSDGQVGTPVGRGSLLAAPLLTAALLWPQAQAQWSMPVDRDLERTYAFVASLPKETLVAAHPTLADYFPLRTRRSVLTSTETSMPWLREYYRIVKPRVEASLKAAYATDIAELDALLVPHGVDVFVTGPGVFDEARYHEPYNELLEMLLARGRAKGFALESPPEDRILFKSGDYYVLRVGLE